MKDSLGAFRPGAIRRVEGAGEGPLQGVTFAVKDLFDVAGMETGAGNPDWLESAETAEANAHAVQAMLDAGATMVGKTITDELAFGLAGENFHYGTPMNTAAPDRIPGGSSSGSVSAVAGGICDTALGTDTGGSVRVPSSHCGVYGLRTTHGRISKTGLVPLAESFDTVGWFARDAKLLKRVGETLLPEFRDMETPTRLLVVTDALAELEPAAVGPAAAAIDVLSHRFETVDHVQLTEDGLSEFRMVFRSVQGFEAWQAHGAWIERADPAFGPGVKERFAAVSGITQDEFDAASEKRAEITARVRGLLDARTVLCVPSAAGAAPLKGSDPGTLEDFRNRTLNICAIAGLSKLPQVSIPAATVDGCPLGISLVALPDHDEMLLQAAAELN